MSTVTDLERFTAKGAAKELARRAREQGVPPSKAGTASVLARVTEDGYNELARHGLIQLAGVNMHESRSGRVDDGFEDEGLHGSSSSGSRTQQPGRNHLSEAWNALKKIQLETQDGEQMMPVGEMPLSELRAAHDRYARKTEGLAKKRDVLKEAAESVEHSDAGRILDLPDNEKDCLEHKIREAWS